MTTRYAFAWLALAAPMLLLGCKHDSDQPDSGTSVKPAPDTGEPAQDSGTSALDSGSPALDAGSASALDAGTADVNAPDSTVVSCIRGSDELIADFTDDNDLNPADGRAGGFDVYGDSKGSFEPAKVENEAYPIDMNNGSQCSGPGAFHTKATGFSDWGAAIGADLMPKSGVKKGTYDASKYKGISFWAKTSAPLKGVQVRFPDIYTDGGADPSSLNPALGPCVFESGSPNNCSPYLVKFGDSDFPAYKDYQIDTTWKRFDIFFADAQQDFYNPGFHTAEDKVDSKHLTAMSIQVNLLYLGDIATANDFEIWIDDIYFIK